MDLPNQTPEQKARDNIDQMLKAAGWKVQDKKAINFSAGPGIAVKEYQTDIGPADYVLLTKPPRASSRQSPRAGARTSRPSKINRRATPKPSSNGSAIANRFLFCTRARASSPGLLTRAIRSRARARSSPFTARKP
jgi:hypothetical protein